MGKKETHTQQIDGSVREERALFFSHRAGEKGENHQIQGDRIHLNILQG